MSSTLSFYQDLSTQITIEHEKNQQNHHQKQDMHKVNKKIQYNDRDTEIMQLQNEIRILRQKLAKKQQYISYMSIKSIQITKNYMDLLKEKQKSTTQDSQIYQKMSKRIQQLQAQNVQFMQNEQKINKMINKFTKYKAQNTQLKKTYKQKIEIFQINKKSMEDRYQIQIESMRSRKQDQLLKLSSLQQIIKGSPQKNQKMIRIINDIRDSINQQ